MRPFVAKETNNHFGRYRVLGALGTGAWGKLYLTVDPAGEHAALLIFHSQVIADVRLRAAILDGAQAATTLEHPNLAATYESGEAEGRTFVTSEYLPGESLASVMAVLGKNSEPVPAPIVATILRELATGLGFLHAATDGRNAPLRLLHRDLRPANVFVTFNGAVKVLGAGVAAAMVTSPDLRATAKGGFGYASPEDVQAGVLDARSDLFSLGVMLWECLTGKRLFGADSTTKTIDAVRSRYVEPPSVLRPSVPPGLDEMALRLLARDPRRRYQTTDELIAAIDTVLASLGGPVAPAALGEWMEGLFGRERAELKRQIAKGVAVEAALARLRLLGAVTPEERGTRDGASPPAARRDSQQVPAVRPSSPSGQRPVVSASGMTEPAGGATDARPPAQVHARPGTPVQPRSAEPLPPSQVHLPPPAGSSPRMTPAGTPMVQLPAAAPVVSAPPAMAGPATLTAGARRRRVNPLVVAGAILGVGGIIAAVILATGESEPSEGAKVAVGVLDIQSTPPGARVLLDGDPSGLTTPAHVTGLRAGRRIEVQVDKPGYKAGRQTAEITAGATRTVVFQLEEAMGTIRLQGLPPTGAVFVDDQQADASGPLALPLGPHRIRVELAGKLFASTKVDVVKGEQTVRIRPLEEGGK